MKSFGLHTFINLYIDITIMSKPKFKVNEAVKQIFSDLENYLSFCQSYGYRYNEADLYNFKSYPWQQYNKFINGKNAKNMWEEDSQRLRGRR